MRKQIIDFADSIVNQMMMFREYMQTEDRIDKAAKKLLDSEYFKLMMQPNDERKRKA